MPDPKQMSGIPRPVDDLPTGSLSVRLIRGELSNNIANHPVELKVGDETRTVNTDEGGRAQFDRLPAGAVLQASAVVDGERLESQQFPAPVQGGIRLMLVATDKALEAKRAAEAAAPPVTQPVSFGGESRIVIEPGDESISLFYLLEIVNPTNQRINPPTPVQFDMPTGALSTTIMQGSSPLASNSGAHVRILGPFPPGTTSVEIGASLPVTSGTMNIEQRFPVGFDQLVVVAKKEGELKLASAQLTRIQDTANEGTAVIIGVGGTLPANQPLALSLSGLAHHSPRPRQIALTLTVLILATGVFALTRPQKKDEGDERKRLTGRREKLLQDLVRLEQDRRREKIDAGKYQERRESLLKSLEAVYGALDTADGAMEPTAAT